VESSSGESVCAAWKRLPPSMRHCAMQCEKSMDQSGTVGKNRTNRNRRTGFSGRMPPSHCIRPQQRHALCLVLQQNETGRASVAERDWTLKTQSSDSVSVLFVTRQIETDAEPSLRLVSFGFALGSVLKQNRW